MSTSSPLTELRQAALALWKHQRQELERDAARQAAERALDVFGDSAGPLADPQSWRGNDDGDAVAVPALDLDGDYRLEYDHTFDEQLWLRSGCPTCGKANCRVTPVGSVVELGQALDRLEEAWRQREEGNEVDADDLPGACDNCDDTDNPASRLQQAVLDVVEAAAEEEEDEEEEAAER